MKEVSSSTRFTGTWEVEIQVETGSVPDRIMPWTSRSASYRPNRLRLVFRTGTERAGTAALRMENGSGFMKQVAESVTVSSAVIFGPRLKKDGTPGQQQADETFYPSSIRDGRVPEWVLAAVREHLTALGCKS